MAALTAVDRSGGGRAGVGRRARRLVGACLVAGVAVGGLVACDPPVVVLDLTVTTAVDGNDAAPGDGVCEKTAGVGDCTLRAAITEANATAGYDVITIAPGVAPVLSVAGTGDEANATGDLDVAGDVRIVGNGATVDGAWLERVFDIRSGRARLEDVTVTGGAGPGAGVRSVGHLDLVGATVTGNAPGNAAVIDVSGGAALTRSEVVANTLPSSTASALAVSGGATLGLHQSLVVVSNGSGTGLRASGSSRVVVVDSTLQAGSAGVIRADGSAAVTVARSTLSKTTGAAAMVSVASLAELTVVGSILDHATALPGSSVCPAGVVSGGWNVASHVCDALVATGDVQSSPVWLHPLADNGGATPTMLPFGGSPVLDRIPAGTPVWCETTAVDQRGVARPQGGGCDAGAVEGSGGVVQVLDLLVDSAFDQVDVVPGDGVCATSGGACTLRAAAQEINAVNPELPLVGHTITIAPGVHPTLSIAGAGEDLGATGDVDVRVPVVIEGGGAVIDGAGLDRVLDLHGQTAVLRDLTITGGRAVGSSAAGDGGGVRASAATAVEVEGVTFHANTADRFGGGLGSVGNGNGEPVTVSDSVFTANGAGIGGGLFLEQGTITRSLIAGNQAATDGGGIYAEFGLVTVVSSTLSGNYAPNSGSAIVSHGMISIGAELVGSTIVGNTGSASIWTVTEACAQFCYSYENTVMRGTVVVGGAGAPACSAPVTASSFNLVPDGSCGATLPGDPLLGPLAGNGGATATHLPAAGSGAIDAIPAGTAGLCDGSVVTDQRGVARPVGAACDVGAVEQ